MKDNYTQNTFSARRSCLLVTVSWMLLVTACEDFVRIDPPKNELVAKTVFTSDVTANAAMRGIYVSMSSSSSPFAGYAGSMSNLCGLSSDELFSRITGDFHDIANNTILPENGEVLTQWRTLYEIIYSCNSVIEGLNGSQGVSESAKKEFTAEARFIRAFCYFYLVNLWGEVPLVTTTDYRANRVITRAEPEVIYDLMVEDLTAARDMLSPDYSQDSGERVRANQWAASALLARVHLYLRNWEQAELEATKVIENDAMFSLTNLDAIFLKNSSEAIFQLLPTSPFEDSFAGLLYLPRTSVTSVTNFPLLNSLCMAFEADDLRYTEWVRSKTVSGVEYFYPYKYRVRTPASGDPHKEYTTLLRLAEQYLIRAEARAWQNKLTGVNSAQADVNVIRARAGLPNTLASTQEELFMVIAHERRVELFTEGHRWFDLVRAGNADAVLSPVKPDWNATDSRWPVPLAELTKNPMLTQNPGY